MKGNPVVIKLIEAINGIAKENTKESYIISSGYIKIGIANQHTNSFESYIVDIDGALRAEGAYADYRPLNETLIEDTIQQIKNEKENIKIQIKKES